MTWIIKQMDPTSTEYFGDWSHHSALGNDMLKYIEELWWISMEIIDIEHSSISNKVVYVTKTGCRSIKMRLLLEISWKHPNPNLGRNHLSHPYHAQGSHNGNMYQFVMGHLVHGTLSWRDIEQNFLIFQPVLQAYK